MNKLSFITLNAAFIMTFSFSFLAAMFLSALVFKPVLARQINACVSAGCSGELCVSSEDRGIASVCIWKEEFACYRNAECKLQPDGKCGWTPTQELLACLGDSRNTNSITPQITKIPTAVPTKSNNVVTPKQYVKENIDQEANDKEGSKESVSQVSETKEINEVEKRNLNFFDRIIAFFRMLFNR